jgi:hypothetical protein
MVNVERRPARGQSLPGHEVTLLHSLSGKALHQRCALLFSQGWTLQTIGESLNPPRPRSTVHVWVNAQLPKIDKTDPSSLTAPTPTYQERVAQKAPRPKRVSPGIPEDARRRIGELAPTARRYRARVAPLSQPALANGELSHICKTLYSSGVTIRELANAAGVTYRAMARRLGRPSAQPKRKK